MKASLNSKSMSHEAKGFRGYAFLAQALGTWLLKSEVPMASSSADMATVPLTAFCNVFRVELTIFNMLLKRVISCVMTVLSDWL